MKPKRKILLHICCASCLYYSYKILEAEGFNIIGLFYNPNIHGRSEYEKRLSDVSDLSSKLGIELITPPYQIREFFEIILPFQSRSSIKYISDPERFKRKRCQVCYDLRLQMAANEAKKHRLKYFSSTLLVSPFRNHPQIVELAMDIALDKKLTFFYRDLRKGYWQGRNFAKNNSYHQPSYCGCTFSLDERILE